MKKCLVFFGVFILSAGILNAQVTETDGPSLPSSDLGPYYSFLKSRYERLARLAQTTESQKNIMACKSFFAPNAEAILQEIADYDLRFDGNEAGKTGEVENHQHTRNEYADYNKNVLMKEIQKIKSTDDREVIYAAFEKFNIRVNWMINSLNTIER